MSARLMPGDPPNDPAKGRPDWCICEAPYYSRGLLDPACRHDDIADLLAAHPEPIGYVVARRYEYDAWVPTGVVGTLPAALKSLADWREHIAGGELLLTALIPVDPEGL